MLIYFSLLSLLSVFHLIFSNTKKNTLKVNYENIVFETVILLLILLVGFRYKVGGDWGSYLELFNVYKTKSFSSFINLTQIHGFSFNLIFWICSRFENGFFYTNLISGFFLLYGIRSIINQLDYKFLALILAFPFIIVVVGMGFTKQACAIGLFCFSINFIFQKKYFLAFLFILLGITFHISLLFFIMFLFLGNRYYFLIFIIFLILAYLLLNFTVDINFFNKLNIYSFFANYFSKNNFETSATLLKMSMNLLPLVVFFILYDKSMVPAFQKIIYVNLAITQLILILLFFYFKNSSGLERISLYLSFTQFYFFTLLNSFIKNKPYQNIYSIIVICYSFLILFFWLFFSNHNSSWVPYLTIISKY